MSSKIKIAEIFYTLQGEGKYVGVPTIFIRTFGCNFQCRGFGMNHNQLTEEPERIAEQFKKHPEWRYEDLPLASTGCDSYASWHPAFKDLSPVMDIDAILHEVNRAGAVLRYDAIRGSYSLDKTQPHVVITGGEPLLGWQRAYPELLDGLKKHGYRYITFETNGTQAIKSELADYLLRQQIMDSDPLKILFSVSPKLSCSGEATQEALKPDVVASYQQFGEVYLKFVVASEADSIEVHEFVDAYRDAGWQGEVYLMPVGGVHDLYQLTAPKVAELAMYNGWRYSPRLQVDIWRNAWGT